MVYLKKIEWKKFYFKIHIRLKCITVRREQREWPFALMANKFNIIVTLVEMRHWYTWVLLKLTLLLLSSLVVLSTLITANWFGSFLLTWATFLTCFYLMSYSRSIPSLPLLYISFFSLFFSPLTRSVNSFLWLSCNPNAKYKRILNIVTDWYANWCDESKKWLSAPTVQHWQT